MKLRSLWDTATRASKKFAADHLPAYAAQATFYLILAVFPLTMLICMATRLLPVSRETMLAAVNMLLPEAYRGIGAGFINSYFNENIGSTGIFLVLFLIWSASRLIQALINGFNTVYGIRETRSQAVVRLIGCLYTLVLCGMLIALLVMYALGSKLVGAALNQLPGSAALDLALSLIRDLASPLLLFFVFLLSYTMLPGHKVRLRSELPGALMTTVVWRGMAALYSVFLRLSLENYAYVYGALAGIVMFMLWLYACVWFWFAGAELNRWLRKRKGPATLVREHFPLNRLRGKDTGLSTEKDRPSE